MPSDVTTDLYRSPADAGMPLERGDRTLPAGAGLALGVILGAALWGGIIALFMLL